MVGGDVAGAQETDLLSSVAHEFHRPFRGETIGHQHPNDLRECCDARGVVVGAGSHGPRRHTAALDRVEVTTEDDHFRSQTRPVDRHDDRRLHVPSVGVGGDGHIGASRGVARPQIMDPLRRLLAARIVIITIGVVV
jgi:hypothetical protein